MTTRRQKHVSWDSGTDETRRTDGGKLPNSPDVSERTVTIKIFLLLASLAAIIWWLYSLRLEDIDAGLSERHKDALDPRKQGRWAEHELHGRTGRHPPSLPPP